MLKTALRRSPRLAFLALPAALLGIAASAHAAPVIDFGVDWPGDASRPTVGQEVTFAGTVTSWDGVEGVLPGAISWNFGETGGTATGLSSTYAFTSPGLKLVLMTATNGDVPAETTSIPKFLQVNGPPSAAFSWAPASPVAGQDVTFASESDDPDGSIVQYAWDFGDSVTDARRNPAHPFSSAGVKSVTLTVTDAFGATSTVTRDVVVQGVPVAGAPPNKPPIANFAFGPRSPRVGDPVEFVSSAVDPEGNLRASAWDLDGDGQFDDARGDEVLHTFVSAGQKTVRLRVEDASGGAAVRERTVDVRRGPVARAGFLAPAPVIRLNGAILWNGARIKVLSVRAPRGTLVTVACRGKACPVQRRRKRVKNGSVRFKTFERFLRAGTRLEIFSRKPNKIGAYTRYTIRAGKSPARTDRCLAPGKRRPTRCSS